MVVVGDDRIRLNRWGEFEQLYVHLRQAENRIYSDEEVARLPEIRENHRYKKEWEIREASCRRLLQYLKSKKRPLRILEIGCGNGWLAHQLSRVPSSYVIGVDVNVLELQQAERVFAEAVNLAFVYGDIDSAILEDQSFDVVIFAAAIQYFKSLSDILQKVLPRLNDNGEIHLVDSHFYTSGGINKARRRSMEYFRSKGFEGMQEYYFHHSLEELKDSRYTVLHNPNSILSKVFGPKTSFHWICIK